MKFNISKKELSKHISIAQKAISSRSAMQILEGLLLVAENNTLTIIGTDTDLTIITSASAIVEEEGKIVVNSRLFGDIIRKLDDSDIKIRIEKHNMNIICNKSEFNITCQSPDEYPMVTNFEEKNSFKISSEELKEAIRKTSFAVSQEDTRKMFTGVYMDCTKGINFVALDGFRMSLVKLNKETKESKSIIPATSLNELSKILEDSQVDVKVGENKILFKFDNTKLYSNLFGGEYFSYKDLIRDNHTTKVKVDRGLFQISLERASLLAKEERANLIKLEIKKNSLVISSNTEIGNVTEEIPCQTEGDELTIAFNSKYLLDGIKIIEDKDVVLNFTDSVNPCIINTDSYTYLVLPVRLAK